MPGTPYVGEIRMVGFNFAPAGWALCAGQLLPIDDENAQLFDVLGTTYGGDGEVTFCLPDLRGRIPIGAGQGDGLTGRPLGQGGGSEAVALTVGQLPGHNHALVASQDPEVQVLPSAGVPAAGSSVQLYSADRPEVDLAAASIGAAGGAQPHDNVQPSLTVNFIISLSGGAPTGPPADADPFLGEIRMMAGNAVPPGWAQCQGQLVSLPQNPALFSLLGTMFGGNGKSTFALPDLVDAVPVGEGQGPGLSPRFLGESDGSDTVTLLASEMPSHTHNLRASGSAGNVSQPSPGASLAASQGADAYSSATNGLTALASGALGAGGGGVAHNNLQPYLAVSYCIAMAGDFPPRS